MNKVYVKIDGIHCHNCIKKITNALLKISNIKEVKIEKSIASISYTGKLDHEKIIKTIIDLDYNTCEEYINDNINKLASNHKRLEYVFIFIIIILVIFLINKFLGFNIFNVIPTIDSNITYSMLFITGILTSIHCISICGAINLVATLNTKKRSIKKSLLYNFGRVLSYTLIGGIVGLVGSILSINNTISGIIILISSLFMLYMALSMMGILHIKGFDIMNIKIKSNNTFIIGLLNGLMPCGPLQAMQIYALGTGSFIKGALSMFLFSLGTVPLMLMVGIVFNLVKGKRKILLNKIAVTLILVLSLTMVNRGLLTLNVDLFKVNDNNNYVGANIEGNYQVIEMELTYDNYQDIVVKKDVPVKMIIHVDKKYLTGCNNELIINEFNISKKLEVGDNIIEFTPDKTGIFTYTCWMSMIKNNIKVIA